MRERGVSSSPSPSAARCTSPPPISIAWRISPGDARTRQRRARCGRHWCPPRRSRWEIPPAAATCGARAAFFQHAEALYDLHGSYPKRNASGESSVLLEVTPIAKSNDVHGVVERIQQRAKQIIDHELHLEAKATIGFTLTLSEICQ